MAKYYGSVGYAVLDEKSPGVYVETITEHNYYGDIVRNVRRLQDTARLNSDITISNELSIVVDPYAISNFHKIRYATYMGVKWKVERVEVNHPRLTLFLGEVYNAQK